jgi:hypothetical protein
MKLHWRRTLVQWNFIGLLLYRKQQQNLHLRFFKAFKNAVRVKINISPNPIATTSNQISTLSKPGAINFVIFSDKKK